jgi:hypothetical protein
MNLSDCVSNMMQRFGYDKPTATAICQKQMARADAKNKMMGGQ